MFAPEQFEKLLLCCFAIPFSLTALSCGGEVARIGGEAVTDRRIHRSYEADTEDIAGTADEIPPSSQVPQHLVHGENNLFKLFV